MVYFHGHLGNKYYIYGVVESISFKVAVLSALFVCLSVLVTRITQRSGSELRGPSLFTGNDSFLRSGGWFAVSETLSSLVFVCCLWI